MWKNWVNDRLDLCDEKSLCALCVGADKLLVADNRKNGKKLVSLSHSGRRDGEIGKQKEIRCLTDKDSLTGRARELRIKCHLHHVVWQISVVVAVLVVCEWG